MSGGFLGVCLGVYGGYLVAIRQVSRGMSGGMSGDMSGEDVLAGVVYGGCLSVSWGCLGVPRGLSWG